MKGISMNKTQANLLMTFAGESMARNKYTQIGFVR
jgi:rubrerythrin